MLAVICAALLLFLAPSSAWAATSTSVIINGVDIKNAPNQTIACGEGTVQYIESTDGQSVDKLVLENATIEATKNIGVMAHGSLIIELRGVNSITNTTSNDQGMYLDTWGIENVGSYWDITFEGDGSLKIDTLATALYAGKNNITIDGVRMDLQSQTYRAIKIDEAYQLNIKNGANVIATSFNKNVTVNCPSGISVENSTLTATTGTSIAIWADNGPLKINKSTISAQCTDADTNVAIWCGDGIEILNGSKLSARSGDSYGVYVEKGNASIASSELSISGSTGIGVLEGNLELSNATGSVAASSSALYAKVGDISIKENSTLTLEGGASAVVVKAEGSKLSFGETSWYQWATAKDEIATPSTSNPYSLSNEHKYLRIEPIGATYKLTVDGNVTEGVPAGQAVSLSAEAYNDTQHFAGWTLVSGSGVDLEGVVADGSFPMPASDVELKSTYENHTMVDHPAKAPTCVAEGWEAYKACECGYADGKVTVPATGQHTYVNGVCSVCGATKPQPQPSRPTYPPEVPETDGGSIEVSPSRPHEGDEVTVTPEPDEGQEVVGVTVTDEDGERVEVTDNRDGTWSFVQPSGSVTVEVTFDCDGGELCPSRGYADVDRDAWYHGVVDWAVTTGAMMGYAGGAYGPDDAISRAQLATVLWRLAGEPEGEATLPADCDAGAFYSEAVSWALGAGVFSGYESGLFGPADALTREQAATVLWLASGSPEAECDLSGYPDAGDVSEFASAAVRWAVSEGVISGRDAGQGVRLLDPQGTCSRAEVAALLMRLSDAE